MPNHMCSSDGPCPVPPHPDIQHRFMNDEPSLAESVGTTSGRPLGLNDGTIFGPQDYPPNIPDAVIAQAAQDQPNLRGPINVIVVLVNFKNKAMNKNATQYFRDLFFSHKMIPTGSVTEYYNNVSGGKISITGDVVGPYDLPLNVEDYAHGGYGFKGAAESEPNIRTLGNDAVTAVEAAGIDLKKYDNKGRADGHVDAFIVVHAGRGGEQTDNVNDIWSVKWVLPGDTAREVGKSKTKVYPFLTVPEDALLGVCAHEIGHLVFGWPDLYDIKGKSRGVGAWCLMSGGSWGRIGNSPKGTTPCHPSAWCKLDQGWVEAYQDASDTFDLYLNDVKADSSNTPAVNANRFGNIHKLWSNGQASTEYFLIENRTKSGYDASLPGEGLLIWHVDDAVKGSNDDSQPHYRVALMSANGVAKMNTDGDETNPFPGKLGRREFTATTAPSSKSYAGADTFVSVRNISDAGRTMRMSISVKQQSSNKAAKL